MNKPFVKLFSTLAGKYFYDVNKNEIIEITEEEYTYLFNMINHDSSFELLKDTQYINIKRLYDNGYFQATYPELIEHELTPYTKAYLSKRLQGITLQVTQNCNFKCRYCSFSGNGYFDRRHNGLKMDKSVAFKAVDLLKNNSVDLKEVRVGFYGGEPLLEYNLIKDVVHYAKRIMPEKKLLFAITTNLTLLTKEMLDFFVENNFNLAASLDGPKEYHDRYRRYAVNGLGTFDGVYQKLKLIYDTYPNYFSEKLTISAVIEGDDNLDSIQTFFNSGFLSKTKVSYSALDSSKTDFKRNPTEDFFSSYKENIFKSIINNHIQNTQVYAFQNDVLFSNSGEYDDLISSLARKTPIKRFHHAGPCIPGQAKMLIAANGDIFTCEKASNHSQNMNIGNIFSGIDYDKVYSLLNVGKITEQECKRCWAIRFCSSCAINIDNINSLSKELKLKECEITLKSVESLLKNHVTITKLKELVR